MKAVKIAMKAALKAQPTLGRIFVGWPQCSAPCPCTAFYRISGSATAADGELAGFDELYSVDLFGRTVDEIENMELAANTAMNTLPYIVLAEHGPDLFEETAQVHHKVMRYRIKS